MNNRVLGMMTALFAIVYALGFNSADAASIKPVKIKHEPIQANVQVDENGNPTYAEVLEKKQETKLSRSNMTSLKSMLERFTIGKVGAKNYMVTRPEPKTPVNVKVSHWDKKGVYPFAYVRITVSPTGDVRHVQVMQTNVEQADLDRLISKIKATKYEPGKNRAGENIDSSASFNIQFSL